MAVVDTPARSIGEEWAGYLAEVIPTGAPALQVEECKRAFYAGANGMFQAMFAATSHDDEVVCEARLEALSREMLDFIRLFKKREGCVVSGANGRTR
jgi:hypothetical protein